MTDRAIATRHYIAVAAALDLSVVSLNLGARWRRAQMLVFRQAPNGGPGLGHTVSLDRYLSQLSRQGEIARSETARAHARAARMAAECRDENERRWTLELAEEGRSR